MSADCAKLKNSNCFRCAHKGDFQKFGHIYASGGRHFLKCPESGQHKKVEAIVCRAQKKFPVVEH